ncbi:preprotein translocase subunit YajC [Akkermansiaceae bacterium]|nr:preprotein translocase subunit YajC [Akkermansiaceae bacterium]
MTTLHIFAAAENQGLFGNPIVMIVLMIVMFYFLLIRPQQKQRKDQEARVNSIEKGDKVVTVGGLHSVVHHISEKTVTLKLSEGVFVPFEKSSIQSVEKASKGRKKDAPEKIEEKS